MPGRRCAVFGCNNSKIGTKAKGQDVIFHNFPKGNDLISTNTRNEWIQRCKRVDMFNPSTSQICSIHFKDIDYQRDLQNELLGLPMRKFLKKTAVPTLNLNLKHQMDVVIKTSPLETRQTQAQSQSQSCCTIIIHEENTQFKTLEEKYNHLHISYLQLKKTSQMRIKKLNNQLKFYKEQYLSKTKKIKNLLNNIFTKNQIALLLNKKKRINWTKEEILIAFTLRHYSKNCYLYLRNKLHYPLPGLSSLRRWAQGSI